MHHVSFSRRTLYAAAASGVMLFLGGAAFAQSVPVFDEAPTLEQLRSIMIPPSPPGLSRTIVIQHPDLSTAKTSIQTAAAQVAAPPRPAPAPAVEPAAAKAVPTAEPPTAALAQAAPAATTQTVGFHINFAFNSAALPDSAHAMIDRVAELMKENPELKVRVEGHTDAKGAPGYNMALSERRALSVGEYIVSQGIEPSRLVLVGKGMTEPLTSNPYDPANRRVQFVRIR